MLQWVLSRVLSCGAKRRSSFRMNRATSQMRGLAKDLMAYEMSEKESSQAKSPAAFRVTEKLRPHVANLMGIGGFRALLSRALVLAAAEVSWPSAVHVKADGTLEGLDGPCSQLAPAESLEGRVVLLAQLFGLMVALIGPTLTSRLVGEIWPEFHSAMWDSAGKEVDSEKAK
jgi:hypothetical protein